MAASARCTRILLYLALGLVAGAAGLLAVLGCLILAGAA